MISSLYRFWKTYGSKKTRCNEQQVNNKRNVEKTDEESKKVGCFQIFHFETVIDAHRFSKLSNLFLATKMFGYNLSDTCTTCCFFSLLFAFLFQVSLLLTTTHSIFSLHWTCLQKLTQRIYQQNLALLTIFTAVQQHKFQLQQHFYHGQYLQLIEFQ